MNKRVFLVLLFTVWFAYPLAAEEAPLVTCDTAPLKTVIMLNPGEDMLRATYDRFQDEPFGALFYVDGAIRQHAEFAGILSHNGVQVLNIVDLLQNAVANARKAGKLDPEIAEIFPEQYPRLKSKMDSLTALAVLGRLPAFSYNYSDSGYMDSLIPSSPGLFYTRDFAVSTPKGIILTRSRAAHRQQEARIGRFLFRYADALAGAKVVFDAGKEGVRCEGGDMIVLDEHTLLMGINNLSDREAAQKIAAKLGIDVLGVSMPPLEDFSGANIEILHLDTVFNLVDKKKALTVPYFFMARYSADNPVVRFLKSMQDRPAKQQEKGDLVFPSSLQKAIDSIPKVGWLTQFAAGTGEPKELGKKLGDYLIERGYELIPVGGDQGAMSEDQYVQERVLYELGLQAANVVQLAPGKIVAYAHNRYTNEGLRKHGVRVLTFEGKYLADGLGGPHCMTMPLKRSPL